jgi:hypothetical protein
LTRTLEDADSSIKAVENRAVTGDNILNNLFERPFTLRTWSTSPISIFDTSSPATIRSFTFTITLDGNDPASGTLSGTSVMNSTHQNRTRWNAGAASNPAKEGPWKSDGLC